VLVRQNALVADATIRPAVSYGSANARMMAREVVGGVNRAEARRATANSTSSVDFSGIHAVRAIFTGVSTISTDVDAIAGTPGADTGSTVAGVMNIFSAFALFWNGSINSIWITAPLTAGQAAQMWAYLKTRGGIA
jgi:hypothetical protein